MFQKLLKPSWEGTEEQLRKKTGLVVTLKNSDWFESNCWHFKQKHFLKTVDLNKYDLLFFVDKHDRSHEPEFSDIPELPKGIKNCFVMKHMYSVWLLQTHMISN